MHEFDPVLRLAEITRLLSRSASSINRDRRLGLFPSPIRIGRRAVGWRRSEIEAWLKEREGRRDA